MKKNAGISSRRHYFYAILASIIVVIVLETLSSYFIKYYELWQEYRFFRDTHFNQQDFSTWKKNYLSRKTAALTNQMMLKATHPYIGYTFNPGFAYRGSDSSEPNNSLIINSFGLRDREFSWKKDERVFRILCLGESTTAWGSSTDTTYPAFLQQKLREYLPAKQIEVINAGIDGYKVWNSLNHYMLRLYELTPDLIIIYHGFNDIKNNHHPAHTVQQQKNYPPLPQNFFRHTLAFWIEHSATIRVLHMGYSHLKILFFKRSPTVYDDVSEEGLRSFEKMLESLILIIQARHTPVVLLNFQLVLDGDFTIEEKHILQNMLASHCYSEYDDRLTITAFRKVFDEHNKIIRKLAEQYHTYFIDMSQAVPETKQYFFDCIHRTDLGNEVFAEVLAKHLIKFGVIKENSVAVGFSP
jgi:lysophospholipase L1-like esterase